MTPLRVKMIRELELQRKSPRKVEAYATAVAQLAQHFGRSPEELSLEEVRDFLHDLITERHAFIREERTLDRSDGFSANGESRHDGACQRRATFTTRNGRHHVACQRGAMFPFRGCGSIALPGRAG